MRVGPPVGARTGKWIELLMTEGLAANQIYSWECWAMNAAGIDASKKSIVWMKFAADAWYRCGELHAYKIF